jgi:hypothetical protein
VHYQLVSQANQVFLPNGAPYENTDECWTKLANASRDARYLRLVPIEHFVDRRNDDPIEHVVNRAREASLSIDDGSLSESFVPSEVSTNLPGPPGFDFVPPVIDQRFHVELWAEKTTQNDILIPLARQYGLNVVTASGETSLTACWNLVQRAKRIGRPVRILYISDFDPAGRSMPVACARKIQFVAEDQGLDIQVRPVVLTPEQCQHYRLPRTPLKDTERRAGGFEARFGEGATELDALEALHPGELRRILVSEIERYYDDTLNDRLGDAADDFTDQLDEIRAEAIERHRVVLDAARADYRAAADQCNEAFREVANRFGLPIRIAAERFNAVQGAIAEDLRAATPDDTIETVEPDEGDEDDDPLFDTTRGYIEQIDRFKQHQGKPTERKKRAA